MRVFPARRSAGGFTLLELMVALVVVGLLAALAYPAFLESIRKGRRSEAFASLAALQQAQERWRAGNARYSADLAALDIAADSANRHYRLSVLAADATSYTLRAQAQGSQAQDKSCATMLLETRAGSVNYGSACSTCALPNPLADPSRCWSRQ